MTSADYECLCKKCGKCCSPTFFFDGEVIRLGHLKCRYLGNDNLCTIYDNRKEIAGCFSAEEIGMWRPTDCAFGGVVRTINGSEEKKFLINPPEEFIGSLLSGIFEWR